MSVAESVTVASVITSRTCTALRSCPMADTRSCQPMLARGSGRETGSIPVRLGRARPRQAAAPPSAPIAQWIERLPPKQ